MKTLKEFTQESKAFYTENASTYFSKSYNKKMGGTQSISFEDNFIPTIELDDREFYQGRRAKYNNASMHEHITVFVTLQEFNDKVNYRAKMLYQREKDKTIERREFRDFCKLHQISASNFTSVVKDTNCIKGLYFDRSKQKDIEKELNVNLDDFFYATGKTYYFAETTIGFVLFFHNHQQSYSFEFVSNDRFDEFQNNRERWVSAPYADILGQNTNPNLLVC